MNITKKNWVTHSLTDSLVKIAKKNKKIVVLDADLSDDLGLNKFSELFPKRFIQNGIAEQDMVSMAGGIALNGLLPVVNSFASFMTARANEQIYNNATEHTKIIYLNLYAGLLPAGAGKSHQSLRDISLLSSIPNFKIYQPLNSFETDQILNHCIFREKNNCAIRLSIGPPPQDIYKIKKKLIFKDGQGHNLSNGKSVLIFAYGQYIINEVLKAEKILKKVNIFPKIINMSSLNKFNTLWLKKVVRNYKYIFSIDDHSEVGGMGDNLLSNLNKNNLIKGKFFYQMGVKDFPECGTSDEVLRFHKLDFKSLSNKIINKIDK